MTSAVPLAAHDARATAGVLARAFQDDPMMTYVMPDPARRRRLLPSLLGGVQRYCLRYGEVTTTDDLAGVACWLPPGGTATTPARTIRTGLATVLLPLGPAGIRRFFRLVGPMERAHHAALPTPHWYLWLLGTEPSRVGQGVGSALLPPVLARADEAGLPVYLETHKEANLAFYGRHGFRPQVAKTVDGVRFWGLRRTPRRSGGQDPEG